MKNIHKFLLITFMGFFMSNTINAMENPHEFEFLNESIQDIYDFVFDLYEANGHEYELLTSPKIFMSYLKILGISPQDKLIDVKYHYLLLKQRLPENSSSSQKIENAYENIIRILSEIDDYTAFRKNIYKLYNMPLREVEALELKGIDDAFFFLKKKKKLIDKKIEMLKGAESSHKRKITMLLGLPQNASDATLKATYDKYMQENSADKLVAQYKIGEISRQALKQLMVHLDEVKKAYEQYLKEKR